MHDRTGSPGGQGDAGVLGVAHRSPGLRRVVGNASIDVDNVVIKLSVHHLAFAVCLSVCRMNRFESA